MSRLTSSLLTTSWILALAALSVVPSLKPENANELFPLQSRGAGAPSNPHAFILVCPEPQAFTTFELAASLLVIAAAVLWLVSVALMARDGERIIGVFVKGVRVWVRRIGGPRRTA